MTKPVMDHKNGATVALLTIYKRALNELIKTIDEVTDEELTRPVDYNTKDEDCRSIQTILTHVVQSGYTYAIEVRRWRGEAAPYREKEPLTQISHYKDALWQMYRFNEELFHDYPDLQLTEQNPEKKIKVRWGQFYDVEQLFEHAIVHISRHAYQIEKFKRQLQE